jgi:hypothetical protein
MNRRHHSRPGRARRRFGAALLATALSCAPAVAQDTSWASGLRADGWPDGTVTADGEIIIFRRPAPNSPDGYRRLQLRYEYRDGVKMGGRTYFTLLSVVDFDCKARRFRNVRMAAFTGRNAQGQSVQEDGDGTWESPAAGTVDGKSLAAACGK